MSQYLTIVSGVKKFVTPVTADFTESTNKKFVTDAMLTVLGNTSGTNTGDNATNSQYSSLVTNATHTGDVTGSGALTIAAKAVTLSKMNDVNSGTVFYRKSASAGAPEVQTLATLKTDLGLGSSGDYVAKAGDTMTGQLNVTSALQVSTGWGTLVDTDQSSIGVECVFRGKLYAMSYSGGQVWKYDGITWSVAYDSSTSAFLTADMVVYQDKLYAIWDQDFWVSTNEGVTWTSIHTLYAIGHTEKYYKLIVYKDILYILTGSAGVTRVDSYDGTTYLSGIFAPVVTGLNYFLSAGVFGGKLYIGGGDNSQVNAGCIYVFDGVTWSAQASFTSDKNIDSICSHEGKLYCASTTTTNASGKIYVMDDSTGAWTSILSSSAYCFTCLCSYNGKLCAGTSLGVVYVYNGNSWTLSYDSPSTSVITIVNMSVYNGKLIVGTYQGGEVLTYSDATEILRYQVSSYPIENIPHLWTRKNEFQIGITAPSINKITVTPVANGSTITLTDGVTLTVPLNSSVSGTNTGDNAINSNYSGLVTNATHTGDVTGSGALTISAKAVTLAKMDDVSTSTIFYRKSAGTGAPEVQTLTTLKTDLGLTGTNSGDQPHTIVSAGAADSGKLVGLNAAGILDTTVNKEMAATLVGASIDLSTGNLFSKTITGSTAFSITGASPAGVVNTLILDLVNPGTNITWWGGIKWAGGVAPTLTVTGRDILGFFSYDGGASWVGLILSKNVS